MKIIQCGILSFLLLGGCVCQSGEKGIELQTLVKSVRSWDGAKLPPYPAGQPEVTVLKITIPPGMRLPVHKHPVINAGVMLKGELTVIVEDGSVLKLKAGDSLVELVDKWHRGENRGREPAEILVFYAGVEGKPVTVKRK